ncbi:MAG: helix-turn-helix transcriptional regulator [Candidatus Omnitrophota bacterium]
MKRLRYGNFKHDLNEELKKGGKFRHLFRIESAKLRVAQWLGDMRETMGLTQGQLAKKMNVSQQLISRIESGSDNLTLETLIRFLEVFNVSIRINVDTHHKKKELLTFA